MKLSMRCQGLKRQLIRAPAPIASEAQPATPGDTRQKAEAVNNKGAAFRVRALKKTASVYPWLGLYTEAGGPMHRVGDTEQGEPQIQTCPKSECSAKAQMP
jgi:hypothetical protein